MSGIRRFAVPVLAIAIAGATGTAAADAVKYRQSVMKANSAHMAALNHIAKGAVPHSGHLLGHAQALEATIAMVADAFKEKSMEGETNVTEKIWSDWAGFEGKANEAKQAAAAVVKAAQGSGDIAAALKDLGAVCGSCHKGYRAKN